MDADLKQRLLDVLERYLPGLELPLTFEYRDDPGDAEAVAHPGRWTCVIAQLARARAGRPLAFEDASLGCSGSRHYGGFRDVARPDLPHFLSCGIPGRLEGERYKKTPATVERLMAQEPRHAAPARFLVAKRWDALGAADEPGVTTFLARPDELAGLFTLANYERDDAFGVITPFGAGCATILQYPFAERAAERPRAVLGMFDVSARPYVPAGVLTFAVPQPLLVRMLADADESFLGTPSWATVRERMARAGAPR